MEDKIMLLDKQPIFSHITIISCIVFSVFYFENIKILFLISMICIYSIFCVYHYHIRILQLQLEDTEK